MTKRSGLEMKRETGSGSGTASLVRASIRAAHYGNSRASERVLHPRRSARIVEPANNETRIELKAHSMPLYTDQTHKISIPPSSFRGPQNTKVLDRSRESQDAVKTASTTTSQHSNYTFPSRGLQANRESTRASSQRHIDVALGGAQMMSGDRRSSSLTQAQSFNQEKQQQPVFQGPNHVVSAVNGERRPSTASACLGVESGRREGSMSADDKGNTTRADSFGAGRDGHNLIGCAMVSSSCVTKSSESASSALNASDFGIKGVNNTSLPGPTSGKHNLSSPGLIYTAAGKPTQLTGEGADVRTQPSNSTVFSAGKQRRDAGTQPTHADFTKTSEEICQLQSNNLVPSAKRMPEVFVDSTHIDLDSGAISQRSVRRRGYLHRELSTDEVESRVEASESANEQCLLPGARDQGDGNEIWNPDCEKKQRTSIYEPLQGNAEVLPARKINDANRELQSDGSHGRCKPPTNLGSGRDGLDRRDANKDRDREKRRESQGSNHPSIAQVTGEKPPSDGVFFAQYKGHPETLVVYRSPEERAANPERLNLDRRHLTVCPILKSEERVRLLNYQNNYIEEIRHLSHLPNLIFLDLYNNCIESLSRDLECVPTLRVLMLGKNRIKAISHLEKLGKLDVLDLHSNAIAKVEHLGALSELRVLNLAGNRLTELDELGSLQSLTELNVRRNQIVKACSLQQLQSLQRVFLSNNRVQSFDAVACLFDVRFLMELSMDGNPIALQDPHAYRRFAVERVKTLRHLDLKRVTDAERRAVALESQKEDERRRAAEKHEMLELERRKLQAERHEAIRAAERQWIDRTGPKDHNHNSSSRNGASRINGVCHPSRDHGENRPSSSGSVLLNNTIASNGHPIGGSCALMHDSDDALGSDERPCDDVVYLPRGDRQSSKRTSANGAIQALASPSSCISTFPATGDASKTRPDIDKGSPAKRPPNPNRMAPAAGYYEVEIGGVHREERALQLYGEAWECLESPKIIGSSTALVCRFVSVERIVEKLRPHARNFARLKKATFGDNAIHTLRHVIQLANMLHGTPCLVELKIESNPVCTLRLLRPLICAVLPAVERFNGLTVSASDRTLHSAQLGAFRDHAEATDKHNKSLSNVHDIDDHDAAKRVITTATTNALYAEEFRRMLDKYWPEAIHQLVDECMEHDALCDTFFANEPVWQ
mmetsp:Transcript_28804/g.93140  ORF Transcript_28804/g.93140 Transcript_28804/m.93140 type:complete len:1171 (-) Transcript_28804:414-3926(-)